MSKEAESGEEPHVLGPGEGQGEEKGAAEGAIGGMVHSHDEIVQAAIDSLTSGYLFRHWANASWLHRVRLCILMGEWLDAAELLEGLDVSSDPIPIKVSRDVSALKSKSTADVPEDSRIRAVVRERDGAKELFQEIVGRYAMMDAMSLVDKESGLPDLSPSETLPSEREGGAP